jgi:hypothetical protein
MKKCYGWLTLKSEVFSGLSLKLAPPVLKVDKMTRFIYPGKGKEYTAIVYEYVEEGENDPDAVQQALNFFWLTGFGGTLSQLAQNWKSSVLIDLCDIAPPRGYGWHKQLYKPSSARQVLGLITAEAGDPPPTRRPPPARPRTPPTPSQQPDTAEAPPPPSRRRYNLRRRDLKDRQDDAVTTSAGS